MEYLLNIDTYEKLLQCAIPYILAATHSDIKCISMLIEHGNPSVDILNVALMAAATVGLDCTIKLLFACGADVNYLNSSVLSIAALYGQYETV